MKLGLFQSINPEIASEGDHPPLGLGYLSSYLKRAPGFKDICFSKDINELVRLQPDLVGITCVTQNYNRAIHDARLLQQKTGARIIIGGTHITSMSESLHSVFDVGVIGDNEQTLADLVRLFQNRQWSWENWQGVNNLVFRDGGGRLRRTSLQPSSVAMDQLPSPDLELLGDRWNHPLGRFICLVTSRGCPYDCLVCSSSRHYHTRRALSPKSVVREIERVLDRWQPEAITFMDDLFVSDRARLREISRLIREKHIQERVEFRVSVRADLVDEDLLRELKRFNVRGINFGAESGSDRILAYLKNQTVTVEQNQRAIDLAAQYDILVGCSFVIGAPPETREDLLQTLHFATRNRDKLEEANFYPVVVLPNTPLWRWARENGKIRNPVNWDALSFSPNGDAWWNNYYYLNQHMRLEEFRLLYYQLKRLSLEIANRKAQRRIDKLENALKLQWQEAEDQRQFRNRRSVRMLEKMLRCKDAIAGHSK